MSLFLLSLITSSVFFTSTAAPSGFTVDLFHRDSPKSPSYDPSHTRFDRMRSAFDRSFDRKSSLASSLSASLKKGSIDVPISPRGGEYLMKIKLGTPPVEQLVIVDTGSDVTWTQCQPCTLCYKQDIPIFEPSKSSTYREIPCGSSLCNAASGQTPSCSTKTGCQYQVLYNDKSFTTGDLAEETLTVGGNASFAKFAFGCGHKNTVSVGGIASGIIGLGGGEISLVRQLEKSIAGKFSYCLTLLNSNATSKISFGNDAVVVGPNVVSTPLVKKSPATYYYLTLEGISVGNETFNFRSASRGAQEGNIFIDSGTTMSFVPPEIYRGLEAAMLKAIRGRPVPDPKQRFGLCYGVRSAEELKAPPVTAHFAGADLVLAAEGIFVEVQEGLTCLTFVASQDLAVFGNLHQGNYRVGYDLVENRVRFQKTDCSKLG